MRGRGEWTMIARGQERSIYVGLVSERNGG